MHESDDYIKELWDKLKTVEDKELLVLVKKLIDERNHLIDMANIDPLTGLHNRRSLNRVREFSGVLMMDIDDFKSVNDTFGHDIGDEVLKRIGLILKNHVRAKDYACRFGGDEFCIVFIDCEEEVIKERAEEIRKAVMANARIANTDKDITVSIGYSFNNNNKDFQEVMKEADTALYTSKTEGKNCITSFTQDEQNFTF